jgi:hypothetical protein
MVFLYILFGWLFFIILGFILFELRPDKYILYLEMRKLRESTRFKLTFPLVVFICTPFTIYYSIKRILEK